MSRLNTFIAGTRVLDLSRHLPGPLATLLLADMGAIVAKVEPPAGEEMRSIGPQGPNGRSVYFDAVAEGKRGVRLNLRNAADRETLMQLVREADVFVHSFRPGFLDRLGLGDAALAAANPRLIRCAMTGYGENSPMREAAGHDVNYLALSGILHRNAMNGTPAYFDPPVADVSAGLFAAITILGALNARHATGEGCAIDLALADAVMPLQSFQLADLAVRGRAPRPRADLLNGGAAFYQIYATRDGRHVALGSVEPKFWRCFCEAAGRPDWIARQTDALPQDALIADVAKFFGSLDLAEIDSRFSEADCCLTPVLDLAEAAASRHHARRGLLHAAEGRLQALFPALVDRAPPSARRPFEEGRAPRDLFRD